MSVNNSEQFYRDKSVWLTNIYIHKSSLFYVNFAFFGNAVALRDTRLRVYSDFS